ncbi:MAG: HEAT repeat domain-containing protein [Verrucomicrobiae bacterium]|nr:HEAT repeat domain-containing protein [Verrucomicrobiae bacterium]
MKKSPFWNRATAGWRALLPVVVFHLTLLGPGPDRVEATDLIGGEAPHILTPEESLAAFTMAEGFEINLWASEVEMPILSPCAMTFDSEGRLWVTCIPSQPHALPDKKPQDSLVVLEDTDRDGVADKSSVFYHDLYLAMGLAVTDGGKTVYVCDEPNLLKLTDEDGDLKADKKEIFLHGFGTEDNHHFISGFQWGPGGRLFFGQGLFLNTQVETPYGPVRAHEAAVFRLDPRDQKLEVFGNYGWSNVWGVVFDEWGQGLIADASPALNYYLSHTSGRFDYPKPGKYDDYIAVRGGYSFTPIGRRPSCGNELLWSEHFPEEVRGWYVTNQMKGWHGLRWYRLKEEGSGYAADQPRGEEELLTTTDTTFRPVAQQIGPDGALYVLDYYNPIVGHTTYSFRDPRHIKTHGRIWRVTAKDRPLVWQPKIRGESVETQLDLLKDRLNHRWRYFARRELQERDPAEVLPVLEKWIAATNDEHDLCEALWVSQGLNHYDLPLLKRLLKADSHDARTAAVRVLRYWQEQMTPDEALALLDAAVSDPSQRVRLEAVVALGFHADPSKAIEVAAKALDQEMDLGFRMAARDTFTWLSKRAESVPETVDHFLLPYISDDELLTEALDEAVCREILIRASLPAEKHQAALAFLGEKNGRDALGELLTDLESISDWEEGALPVFTARLLDWDANELKAQSEAIGSLALKSENASVRAKAGAALLRMGLPNELAENASVARKLDFLGAVKSAGRGQAPDTLADKVVSLLATSEPRSVRLAAIEATPLFPDHDAESLKQLAGLADENAAGDLQVSFAALDAMKRIPAATWPEDYANKVLTRIRISATPNLRFDPDHFSVKAGSAVELTFYNPDNLYHNLVVVDAGALDRVGLAADVLAADPKGLEKNYVPDVPGILHWTPQLTIGGARTHVLRFYAPEKPGDYPYICTFPGHWRAMRGVMEVVE